LGAGSFSAAQSPEPDPAALKAFTELVEAYRSKPGLTIKDTVKISLKDGDIESREQEVTAEFTLGPRVTATRDELNPVFPTGVVKAKGFTCTLAKGEISFVHEKTPDSWYGMADDGAPYYALLSAFIDLPFPELAIAFGEDGIDDLCMQFHPKAPWDKPTAVKDETVDGKTTRTITMSSEFDTMVITVDPDTKLMKSVVLTIKAGDQVQEGATLTYAHTMENTIHEKPLEAAKLAFDPGQRQKVDVLSALMPKAAARGGGGEDAAGELVGQPAPDMVLATMSGKAVNLEELQGRVVVLDFWSTWCGPCRQALPLLHQVAKWVDEKQLPVSVITVNVWEIRDPQSDSPDARLDNVKKFWEKNRYTLPVAMDYSDEVAKAYGIQGIPFSVIIRADGVVHAQHTGAGGDYVETLKRDINEALQAVEAPQ
jgi:thiol-disulfide isomerase/thioredoxin